MTVVNYVIIVVLVIRKIISSFSLLGVVLSVIREYLSVNVKTRSHIETKGSCLVKYLKDIKVYYNMKVIDSTCYRSSFSEKLYGIKKRITKRLGGVLTQNNDSNRRKTISSKVNFSFITMFRNRLREKTKDRSISITNRNFKINPYFFMNAHAHSNPLM